MMKYEEWCGYIIVALEALSNKDYQKNSWFGKGSSMSSPEEAICTLIDDYDYQKFIEEFKSRFSPEFELRSMQLINLIDNYNGDVYDEWDPSLIFYDSRWEDIRIKANEVLLAMKC